MTAIIRGSIIALQSKNGRVKCRQDGELSVGRKRIAAVSVLHPAAAVQIQCGCFIAPSFLPPRRADKGGVFVSDHRKTLLKLTCCAVLTALSVVLGILCKNLFTFGIYYRITFENLPIIIAGLMFGPAAGAVCGCFSDVVSCLLSTNPAVNPLITLGACTVGVVSGLFSKRLKATGNKKYIFISSGFSHLAGQVIVKSAAKMLVFGMPWWGALVGLAVSACVFSIESFIICRLLIDQKLLGKY